MTACCRLSRFAIMEDPPLIGYDATAWSRMPDGPGHGVEMEARVDCLGPPAN